MDALFGDASTAPTPATQGERGSLMSAGSPVPSLDIRRQYGQLGAESAPGGAESAIPGLDIDPPSAGDEGTAKPGPAQPQDEDAGSRSDGGIGGWFSSLVTRRQRGHGRSQYKRLGEGEDE